MAADLNTPAFKKFLFFFLLTIFVPFPSPGQEVTVENSPDWKPMPQSQTEAISKQALSHGGQLLDASLHEGGGGTSMCLPMKTGVNKHTVDSFVAGLINGVKQSGGKFISQSPTKIQSLDGRFVTFEGQANGQEISMITYVVFTDHEVCTFNLYGKRGMTQTDPIVTSYLSRIRMAPSVVPGEVNARGEDQSDRLAFRIGSVTGVLIVILVVVVRSARRKPAIRPPALPKSG